MFVNYLKEFQFPFSKKKEKFSSREKFKVVFFQENLNLMLDS